VAALPYRPPADPPADAPAFSDLYI
jgi:hypothetical protein